MATVLDVKVPQQVLASPPTWTDRVVPFESAVSTTLASYRSGFGLGTEDSPTFTAVTAATLTGTLVGAAPAGSLSGTTLAANVVTSSLTSVGALSAGSITSGFGSIDVGADSITGGPASFTTGVFSNDITVSGAGALAYRLTRGSVTALWQNGSAQTYFGASSNHPIELLVNNATIATVSSTGLAVTGVVTATGKFTSSTGNAGTAGFNANFNGATAYGVQAVDTTDTSSAAFIVFGKASGAGIGSISRVTTTDAVAYNTTSDGRLKTNVRDFTAEDSGRIIDGLRPRWFDWKASDLTETIEEDIDSGKKDDKGDAVIEKRQKLRKVTDSARVAKHITDNQSIIGFIAQEEASVDPALVRIGAVTVGDDDPTTITSQWQRSDAALIPILVAEIKALRARVEALEKK